MRRGGGESAGGATGSGEHTTCGIKLVDDRGDSLILGGLAARSKEGKKGVVSKKVTLAETRYRLRSGEKQR